MAFAIDALWVGVSWFTRQDFLHYNLMLPAVAEIIGVHGLGSDLAQHRK